MKKILFSAALTLGLVGAANAQLVLNEIYPSGGDAGSIYKHDYVEIKNTSGSTVNLDNYKIAYRAPGTSAWSYVNFTSGATLTAGSYWVIEGGPNTNGNFSSIIPNANQYTAAGSPQVMNLAATGLMIAIIPSTTTLANNSCPTNAIDLVGTASNNNNPPTAGAACYEGAWAPYIGNNHTDVLARNPDGTDTQNNRVDFGSSMVAPSPGVSNSGPNTPVKLSGFAGALQSNNSVSLKWTTATETNASFYEIQRSIDGINFSVIGKVNAVGNSTISSAYSFVDANPAAKNLYRLKMVDADSKFEYSNVVAISVGKMNAYLVSPNPAKTVVNLEFADNAKSPRNISIFTMEGKLALKTSSTSNKVQLNVAHFTPGQYTIKVVSDAVKYNTQKLVVQ